MPTQEPPVEVTILRHSKTAKQEAGQTDADRRLSPEGVALAKARRTERRNQCYDLIIGSSAFRTVETAKEVAGDDCCPVVTSPFLFIDKEAGGHSVELCDALGALYERLLNAPLEAYLADPDGRKYLGQFAAVAAATLRELINESGAKNVLVVNHALLGPAIMNQALGEAVFKTNRLYQEPCGECDGIVLNLDAEGNFSIAEELAPL